MHPLTLLPRFRRAYRELSAFEDRERWSRTDIEAFQLERLNTVWAHAEEHVPYYRELSVERCLPHRFSSLAEFRHLVPVLPKKVPRERGRCLHSERARFGQWHFTGGSTGTVTPVFREKAAHLEGLRARYRHAQMWGSDIFDRTIYIWGHSQSFAPGMKGRLARLKQPVEDRLRRRLRLSAYDLSPVTLIRHLELMEAVEPTLVYAYSSCAYLLARAAEELNLHLQCPSLKYVLVTAEPVYAHMVRTIERAFHVPAINEYGATETGPLAAEWPDRTLRVREDLVSMETVPREDGRFDLVVTVLGNPSYPLLRYAIGDVADEPLAIPGSGFAILSNVAGRHNDLIITRSGRPLHSFWFDDLFELNVRSRRHQVHQTADGSVRIHLELPDEARPADVAAIERKVSDQLDGYRVDITVVDRIPPNPAGKHRWIVSELAEAQRLSPGTSRADLSMAG